MALSPMLLLMPAPVRALVISVTQLLPSNSFLWMITEATSRSHSWGPAAGEAKTPPLDLALRHQDWHWCLRCLVIWGLISFLKG